MKQERTIWLVRHGNRQDFVDPDWALTAPRPHDTPLSPDGLEQARDTGRRLASEPIDHLFCSPFLRAVQTACLIGKEIGKPVKVEQGLAEMMLLKWFPTAHDFLPLPALCSTFPGIDPAYGSVRQPVFPETPEQAGARAAQTAVILAESFEGNLLMVGHGGSLYGLCQGLLGYRPSLQTFLCCLIRIKGEPGDWRLDADGSDTSHLTRSDGEIRLA
jgi:broad specificity phosphatase PhoE